MTNSLFDTSLTAHLELFSTLQTVRPAVEAAAERMKAAIAAGGQGNGAPGLRPDYHAHYYGAFVIDPEGNNVEAVCHLPE